MMKPFSPGIQRFLGLQKEDLPVFWGVVFLFFSLRFGEIFLTNFSETAFLKRYGVEHLPLVFFSNGIISFFIVTYLGMLLGAFPLRRSLTWVLLIIGILTAGMRVVLISGPSLIYPILYVMKVQFPAIYLMLFWNLCNELFHTRQAKRLFPLISAGGALGTVAGSYLTAPAGSLLGTDALLSLYGGLMVTLGLSLRVVLPKGGVVEQTESSAEHSGGPPFRGMIRFLKEVQGQPLARILILITLLPNLALPLLNFQFSYILDRHFEAESALLNFYAWFRGTFRVLTFGLLLITPRIYRRLGIPTSLIFHPLNYLMAFVVLGLWFTLPAAIYARVSTSILRTALNNPARGVLVGLLPPALRGRIRPFLRGTVARTGILMGSLVLLLSQRFWSPKDLCWIGLLVVGCWFVGTIMLKRRYGDYLLQSFDRAHLDVRSLDEEELRTLLQDARAMRILMDRIRSEEGDRCSWYAAFLARIGHPFLNKLVLEVLPGKDPQCQKALLEMIPPPLDSEIVDRLVAVAPRVSEEALPVLIQRVGETDCARHRAFLQDMGEHHPRSEVRMASLLALYGCEEAGRWAQLRRRIERSLDAQDVPSPGLIRAIGRTGDPGWIPWLRGWLRPDVEEEVVVSALEGLCRCADASQLVGFMDTILEDPRWRVREALVLCLPSEILHLAVWRFLEDPHFRVRRAAFQRLSEVGRIPRHRFLRWISHPNPQVRKGILRVAGRLSLSLGDLRLASEACLRRAFGWDRLVRVSGQGGEEEPFQTLAVRYLRERRWIEVETGLLICGLRDPEKRMWTVVDELLSTDARMRSNAVEAAEYLLPRRRRFHWISLLDESPDYQREALAREVWGTHLQDGDPALRVLPSLRTQVTEVGRRVLTRGGGRLVEDPLGKALLAALSQGHPKEGKSQRFRISEATRGDKRDLWRGEEGMMSTVEKMVYLREVYLFEDLTVEELAAVAEVAREEEHPPGAILFREGDPADSFFIVIQGEVVAIKDYGGQKEFVFRRVRPVDHFGCMSVFDRQPRAATVKTTQDSRLLVIDRPALMDLLLEIPSISVKICSVLSRRLRNLLEQSSTS